MALPPTGCFFGVMKSSLIYYIFNNFTTYCDLNQAPVVLWMFLFVKCNIAINKSSMGKVLNNVDLNHHQKFAYNQHEKNTVGRV